MITTTNFKEFIETLTEDEIINAINESHDYILMEAPVFNAGGYATVESVDYYDNEEHLYNGNLLCDKDDFIRMMMENECCPSYFTD